MDNVSNKYSILANDLEQCYMSLRQIRQNQNFLPTQTQKIETIQKAIINFLNNQNKNHIIVLKKIIRDNLPLLTERGYQKNLDSLIRIETIFNNCLETIQKHCPVIQPVHELLEAGLSLALLTKKIEDREDIRLAVFYFHKLLKENSSLVIHSLTEIEKKLMKNSSDYQENFLKPDLDKILAIIKQTKEALNDFIKLKNSSYSETYNYQNFLNDFCEQIAKISQSNTNIPEIYTNKIKNFWDDIKINFLKTCSNIFELQLNIEFLPSSEDEEDCTPKQIYQDACHFLFGHCLAEIQTTLIIEMMEKAINSSKKVRKKKLDFLYSHQQRGEKLSEHIEIFTKKFENCKNLFFEKIKVARLCIDYPNKEDNLLNYLKISEQLEDAISLAKEFTEIKTSSIKETDTINFSTSLTQIENYINYEQLLNKIVNKEFCLQATKAFVNENLRIIFEKISTKSSQLPWNSTINLEDIIVEIKFISKQDEGHNGGMKTMEVKFIRNSKNEEFKIICKPRKADVDEAAIEVLKLINSLQNRSEGDSFCTYWIINPQGEQWIFPAEGISEISLWEYVEGKTIKTLWNEKNQQVMLNPDRGARQYGEILPKDQKISYLKNLRRANAILSEMCIGDLHYENIIIKRESSLLYFIDLEVITNKGNTLLGFDEENFNLTSDEKICIELNFTKKINNLNARYLPMNTSALQKIVDSPLETLENYQSLCDKLKEKYNLEKNSSQLLKGILQDILNKDVPFFIENDKILYYGLISQKKRIAKTKKE